VGGGGASVAGLNLRLRAPTDDDWPVILRCAAEAAPWAGELNGIWLQNRRSFDEARYGRQHYVLIENDAVVGYGAIEGDGADKWRLFVVMASGRLADGAGDRLFSQLIEDLRAVEARSAWMREEVHDAALLAFATERAFIETQRFTYEGTEIVVLERAIS